MGSSPPQIVCEAVRLIIDGALDDGGTEAALAQRIGMSPRHLRRPGDLRARRRRANRLAADGGLTLRLPVQPGYDWAAIRSFLAARALPMVENVSGDTYRRTITMAGAPGLIEVSPGRPEFLLLTAFITLLGSPVPGLPDGLTHTFPRPEAMTPDSLRPLELPEPEAAAIITLAASQLTGQPAARAGNQRLATAAAHLTPTAPA